MNRSYSVAGAVLVLGLLLLGVGAAPSVGCETTYALELTERADAETPSESVVNASALPDRARNATVRAAAASDGRADVREVDYELHLDGRAVRHDGTVYETDIVVAESCGGTLEAAALVAGAALSTLGGIGLALLVLYRDDLGPPLTLLHGAAVVALVLGAATFTGGVVAPADCQDNYALEATELGGANATDEPVVAVETFPPELQNATQRAVESNRTAFVDRGLYREHLENRDVRYAGTVYGTDVVLVQDCGGGLDDALLVTGLALATLGAVALALLVVLDHGEKVI